MIFVLVEVVRNIKNAAESKNIRKIKNVMVSKIKNNKLNKQKKKTIVVAVSGGFDPIHFGHVRSFRKAKELGDKLVVILNNDNWLNQKKGYVFMPEKERKEIIESIKYVDEVVLSSHEKNTKDRSVCNELIKIRPDIFANGGDRKLDNIPEVPICESIGCKMVFNIGEGGKVQSSSWMVDKYIGELYCYCGSGKKYKKCCKNN